MIELKSSENTFWYGSHVLAGQSPKGWYFFFAEGPNNYTDQMLSVEKWKLPGLHGFSWVPAGKRFWAVPSQDLRPNDQAVASLQSKSPAWKLISSFSATPTLWSKIFHQELKPLTEFGDNLMRSCVTFSTLVLIFSQDKPSDLFLVSSAGSADLNWPGLEGLDWILTYTRQMFGITVTRLQLSQASVYISFTVGLNWTKIQS